MGLAIDPKGRKLLMFFGCQWMGRRHRQLYNTMQCMQLWYSYNKCIYTTQYTILYRQLWYSLTVDYTAQRIDTIHTYGITDSHNSNTASRSNNAIIIQHRRQLYNTMRDTILIVIHGFTGSYTTECNTCSYATIEIQLVTYQNLTQPVQEHNHIHNNTAKTTHTHKTL